MTKEDKIKAQRKKWNKKYRESQKDGYYKVYLLEDYNYVGYTGQSLKARFALHKCKNNRDCTNHRVLYKTKSKKEAKELESFLHSMGYEGNNTGKYDRSNISYPTKSVLVYEYKTNKFIGKFKSQKVVLEKLNIPNAKITEVCNGTRKQSCGYTFRRA